MAQEEHSRLAVVSRLPAHMAQINGQLGTVVFYMAVAISMTLLNKSDSGCTVRQARR